MTTTSDEIPYFPAPAPAVCSGPPDDVLALVTPVLDDLAGVVARPGSDDLHGPTPCPQWDVEALRDHVLGWLQFFAAALADPDRTVPRLDPDAYRAADDDRDPPAVVRQASATISRAVRGGVQERRVIVSQTRMDGPAVLGMLLGEYLTHGWDLARALDLPWSPDPAACEAALAFFRGTVQPQFRGGDAGMFEAEVPVPADAPALERMLGFAGRDREWVRTRRDT
jgi:uncharacterized protein (TIGR03086 family)